MLPTSALQKGPPRAGPYHFGGRMLLALILLTQLNGTPVWVESTAVVIIRSQSQECGQGHGAVIRVGATALCVRETPDQIRKKIEDAQ
jgi:hypothetical protein